MSNGNPVTSGSPSVPSAPSSCDVCDGTDFVPRTYPTPPNSDFDQDHMFAYHECDECGERYNDRSSQLMNPDDMSIPNWRDIFGHPEPYEHQKQAIQEILKTSISNGFSVVEGGCGTGKTMIALTTGLRLVRDPRTDFERVLVLTSVKQQLRQFEDDLRIINENLPAEIPEARGITLVGKTDLCPYAREEKADITPRNVNSECRRLRDQTSSLMSDGKSGVDMANQAAAVNDRERWSSAGTESPYHDQLPQSGVSYCPFYSMYKERDSPMFEFSDAENSILKPDDIVANAVDNGVCPHSAMSVLFRDADVIVANYYHAFDQDTLQITHPVIDDSTLLVCDEAHMLEPRVRGILSLDVPVFAVKRAAEEAASLHNTLHADQIKGSNFPSSPPTTFVEEKFAEAGLSKDSLKPIYKILNGVYNKLDSEIREHLNDAYDGWDSDPSVLDDYIEIPLRNPSHITKDALTEWFEQQGVSEDIWEFLPEMGELVDEIYTEGSKSGSEVTFMGDVADLFQQWFNTGNTNYFREISLSPKDDPHPKATGWETHFSGSVQLHSVMPRSIIGNRLESFGAGILMSATLEPIDVYREVTGLNFISNFGSRDVDNRVYSADFPAENRLSISLNLPKYTSDNRGEVTDATETRKQYATAIKQLAETTPGNVLVCMPSYNEARWAASVLRQTAAVDKDVLIDESSTEEETQQLKQEFYSGSGKVLVTSLRGTLTEGVDYDGDKLLACAVCGVPIENIGSPKVQAVETAYTDQFGQVGFNYALTVPAVRKARQALGRVIRGTSDVGVRVLMDGRYVGGQGSVRHYLSEKEQEEYIKMNDLSTYESELREFWRKHT